MSTIASVLDNESPPAERTGGARIVPLSQYRVGVKLRFALWMLTAAMVCVLFIAVANVASVALARSVGRAREMAVRTALGASHFRITQELVAENVTIAVVSGVLGTFLAPAGVRLIRAFGPGDVPRMAVVTLDVRVLGFTLVVSLLAGIAAGLLSAVTTLRRNRQLSGEYTRTRSSGWPSPGLWPPSPKGRGIAI